MSINYSPTYCENCKREQAGRPSWGQNIIFSILCATIIGGVIYYFLAKPNCCYICGLKKRHRKDKKK